MSLSHLVLRFNQTNRLTPKHMNIEELIKTTGLKKAFVRKCLREMREIFEPFISRGPNNSIVFDSNALKIFDQIKQEKERGHGLPSIRDKLFKGMDKPDKPEEKGSSQSQTNQPREEEQTASFSLERVIELKDKLHKVEIEKIQAQNELQMIRNNLRLLPAGGDPIRLQEVIYALSKLEEKTKSKFGQSKEVKNLWETLKGTLNAHE